MKEGGEGREEAREGGGKGGKKEEFCSTILRSCRNSPSMRLSISKDDAEQTGPRCFEAAAVHTKLVPCYH